MKKVLLCSILAFSCSVFGLSEAKAEPIGFGESNFDDVMINEMIEEIDRREESVEMLYEEGELIIVGKDGSSYKLKVDNDDGISFEI